MVRAIVASLVVLLGVGAWTLLTAAPAEGHTDFIGADPSDGADLSVVPSTVRLEFSDPMDPGLSTVTMQMGDGRAASVEVSGGDQRSVLVATIPSSLRPDGGSTTRWTVRFRVVSRDGHPVVGSTSFVVRTREVERASSTPAAPPTTGDTSPPRMDADADDGRTAWPLLAVGLGVLALLVLGVGTVIRLGRRDPDT